MILMLAPGPKMAFGAMPSGASYVSDQYGLIKIVNDSVADEAALQAAGCFVLSPFGGWGTFGFTLLSDLYAADAVANLVLPGITGFPRHTIASIFNDGTPANDGTWVKTGTGNGSGNWTQYANVAISDLATAITTETTRAEAAEATLTTNVATNATAISVETTRAEAAEATLTTAVASAVLFTSSGPILGGYIAGWKVGNYVPLGIQIDGRVDLVRTTERTVTGNNVGSWIRGWQDTSGIVVEGWHSDGFDCIPSLSLQTKIGAPVAAGTILGLPATAGVSGAMWYAATAVRFNSNVDGSGWLSYLQRRDFASQNYIAESRSSAHIELLHGESLASGSSTGDIPAAFNGTTTTNGTTLTVSGISAGAIVPGMQLGGTGFTPAMILAFGASGTSGRGGNGTYQLDTAQVTGQTAQPATATAPNVWTPNAVAPGYAVMLSTGMHVGYNAAWDSSAATDIVPALETYDAAAFSSPQGETGQASGLRWQHNQDRGAGKPDVVRCAVDSGVPGFTIAQLSSGTIPYANMLAGLAKITSLFKAFLMSTVCSGMDWIQGVNDEPAVYATYSAAMLALSASIQADIPAQTGQAASTIPIWIAQEACGASGAGKVTAQVHYDLTRSNPTQFLISTPLYMFYTISATHPFPQSYAVIGEYRRKARSVKDATGTWTGLRVNSTGWVRSGATITGQLEGMVSNVVNDQAGTLIPAIANAGFFFDDSTHSASISNVAVTTGGLVTITLSGTPTGTSMRLTYAWESSPPLASPFYGAVGNIHDSDTTPSYAGVPGWPTLPNYLQSFKVAIT